MEDMGNGEVVRVCGSVLSGTALIDKARDLATAAHETQKDKSGHDYIDHPRRVAAYLEAHGADPKTVACGWLHDVLEDTAMTAADLATAGIPDDVIIDIEAVTKRSGETREDYAARVQSSMMGFQVKLADLADNINPARMALLDQPTRDRLMSKYAVMKSLLGVAAQI